MVEVQAELNSSLYAIDGRKSDQSTWYRNKDNFIEIVLRVSCIWQSDVFRNFDTHYFHLTKNRITDGLKIEANASLDVTVAFRSDITSRMQWLQML